MMEGKKFKLCHHWIGKTWRDEADMKVGLFHGQACGTAEALNGNASTLM